jgi:hypothetical protein
VCRIVHHEPFGNIGHLRRHSRQEAGLWNAIDKLLEMALPLQGRSLKISLRINRNYT